jgi:STE24 endopeptidase
MTIKTFITDIIKTLLLKITFLPIIFVLLIKVIDWGGKNFYIYAEIFTIIIIFIFLWIYPNFIAPLYYKFKELEEGEIKERIFKLAQKVNYPLKKLYEVDESTRSAHSNAYLYGIGNNKRIVLYDTLIKKLLPEEIEAVLGHEIGHWKKSHNIKTLIITFIHVFILFYVFGFFMNDERIFLSFGFQNKSISMGLYLYFILYIPISYVIDILQFKLIRSFEYEADQYSKELGYSDQLISGLKKLFEKNLSDMDPDPLYSLVNNTHPTLIERVRALNEKKKSD